MVYAELDPVIDKWVSALGSKLFTEWAGEPARFFYTPGDPPFEVFQINIQIGRNESVDVVARAVDTNDDTEDRLTAEWKGSATELDAMLGFAVSTIETWKVREREKPDPLSP